MKRKSSFEMCWFILDERQYGQCVEVTAVVFVKRTRTNRRMNLTQNLMCSIMFWKWKTRAHDRGVPIRMAWKWNRIMKWFVSICLFAELYDIVNYRLSLSLKPFVCASKASSWNLPVFSKVIADCHWYY